MAIRIGRVNQMSDAEDFDLDFLTGNPAICETVGEFLQRRRELVTEAKWPEGTKFRCEKCGDCCNWNYLILNVDEELNALLRGMVKYPHGSWVMEDPGHIAVSMPGFTFTGNIPPSQTDYIMRTGRNWGYWVLNTHDQIVLYNPTPCIHLTDDKLCGIYENRPLVCREYYCRRHPILP